MMPLQRLSYQTTLQIVQVDLAILRATYDALAFGIDREERREGAKFGVDVSSVRFRALAAPRLGPVVSMSAMFAPEGAAFASARYIVKPQLAIQRTAQDKSPVGAESHAPHHWVALCVYCLQTLPRGGIPNTD